MERQGRANSLRRLRKLRFVLFFAVSRMEQQVLILLAVLTDKYQVVALHVGTVFEITGLAAAMRTLAYRLGMVGKLHRHAVVEHPQAAFPQPVVAVGFTVFDDAAVYLVDVFEAAFFHHA